MPNKWIKMSGIMQLSCMSSVRVTQTDRIVVTEQDRNGEMLLVDTNKEKTLLPLRT